MNKIKLIILLMVTVLLLPNYGSVAKAGTKTTRSLNGEYKEIDTDNLAYDEEAEEETSISTLLHKHSKTSIWVQNGKKYLPFTDQYLNPKKYDSILKKVIAGKNISHEKTGKLNVGTLKLHATERSGKLCLKISNTGKKKLTNVRLYAFQDGKKLRIFADSEQQKIAYAELAIQLPQNANLEQLSKAGAEDLELGQMLSTDGVLIGHDGNGKMLAKSELSFTIN